MKFSVIVLTYESDLQKLFFTLEAVLEQEFDSYEIIVADDGSKENHEEEIRSYFANKQFTNYKLVMNEKNQGTVKNLISALAVAEGKYVRDFGCGDIFYSRQTMRKIYDFMEEKQCEACFGLMRGFVRKQDGSIEKKDFCHPFDMKAYRTPGNEDRILKNLILYTDHISGAVTCYRREYYLEYLKRIQDVVVYEEDIFQVLASLEGRGLKYLDEYIVWYEMGEGVSTKKRSKFQELLQQDVERFYTGLFETYGDQKYIKKRKHLMGLYRIRNIYVRTALRMFINPDAARYFASSMIQRKQGAHVPKRKVEPGFLDEKR